MGSEIVRIYVGLGKAEFAIHKQLLLDAGPIFADMFPPSRKPTDRVILGKEDPQVFKLFVEYLYTKAVPRVQGVMNAQYNDQRLQYLCKLYAFCDKFQVEAQIRNKVIDAIQDGFLLMCTLPDIQLIKSIYQHTMAGSKLRNFCVACLFYSIFTQENVNLQTVTRFLSDTKEALHEFVGAVKHLGLLGRDPRIRDCQGERGCAECLGDTERLRDKHGSWPCQFHIHSSSKPLQAASDGAPPGGGSNVDAEEGCYLWGA